jgi:uncharacterized YigZ family protein
MTQKCRFTFQMESFSFLTIDKPAEGLYKELGSKFLAFAFPVTSESEIKANLEALRKKYFDATHHCYAWVLGADKSKYRAADDGEPNHSAGDPILGQIRSKKLTNVVVVVVRYFGGTKLGVGGLIQAYKAAAEDVLNNTVIIEKQVTVPVVLKFEYETTPEVMRLIKEFDMEIISQEYSEACVMHFKIKKQKLEAFQSKSKLLTALGHTITVE